LSQVLPVLGYMAERGSIIIDGRTIVVSGRVGDNRIKATILQNIAPLTQAGLELEDRILAGSSSAGRSMKTSSPKVPSPKMPSLIAAPSSKAPATKTPSLLVAIAPQSPSLPVAPPPAAPSLI